MARVNPSLLDELGQYNPIHRVTGLFDNHDAVTSAVRDLGDAGFAAESVDLFSGSDGEHALDPSGGAGGTAGRLLRTIEDLVSDTSKFHDIAAATLHAGGFVVAANTDGDDARKGAAMDILTRHGARDVKYWAQWYVEQGYEDQPSQNLTRDDT